MRAKFIDCGLPQFTLWQQALPDFTVAVDVSTAALATDDIPGMVEGYDICIDDHTRIPSDILARCAGLRHFVYFGTGAASILDLALAERMGIEVHTIHNYGDTTVAEMAAGLMMAAARSIAVQHEAIRGGLWRRLGGMELRGRRIGIVGFGGIGREMARICTGIGLEVVVWNRSGAADPHVRSVSLDELFATSDIVSLHLGLNEQTRGFLDAARIAAMKPGAILVNTARGALVDEAALIGALHDGHLGHAALDVFETEPLPADHPLRTAPNVTLTAHTGFMTRQATENQVRLVLGIVERLQGGGRQAA